MTAEPQTVTQAPAPVEAPAPEPAPAEAPAPVVEPPPAPETTEAPPPADEPANVYYKNCAAVWAAGAAPIHRGDPGYDSHLDGDNDGVGCEKPPK